MNSLSQRQQRVLVGLGLVVAVGVGVWFVEPAFLSHALVLAAVACFAIVFASGWSGSDRDYTVETVHRHSRRHPRNGRYLRHRGRPGNPVF